MSRQEESEVEALNTELLLSGTLQTSNAMEGRTVPSRLSPRPHWRIAYCLPTLRPPDPAEASFRQQMQVAGGLRARGHSLTFVAQGLENVVCTTDLQVPTLAHRTWSAAPWFKLLGNSIWRAQRWLGVPYLNVFSNYRALDACLNCLPGHDLVQERNGLYRVGVAMACRRLNLPYVLFFDADEIFEHDFLGDPITGILRRRAQQTIRYTLGAADAIICVSESSRQRLMNVWQVPEGKVVVFPNAVDVHDYRPYLENRSQIRASFGIGEDPLVVFVGRFYAWHDVTTLLDAFALVLRQRPSARLLLVGDGQQRPAMEEHAHQLGLDQFVRFTGLLSHTEIPKLLSAADIAVAPYPKMDRDAWWGSPMKLFEYMASGTALIASALGQMAEVIQDGTNGLLVPAGEPRPLAEAIQRMIDEPKLRADLGRQARRDAIAKYSWDSYVSRLEQLYTAVLAHQPLAGI